MLPSFSPWKTRISPVPTRARHQHPALTMGQSTPVSVAKQTYNLPHRLILNPKPRTLHPDTSISTLNPSRRLFGVRNTQVSVGKHIYNLPHRLTLNPEPRTLNPKPFHPGVELRADLKSNFHGCHFFEVSFVWELTKETIRLPLGCLQGGLGSMAQQRVAGRYGGGASTMTRHGGVSGGRGWPQLSSSSLSSLQVLEGP